jgi:hypothetical protein
MLEAMEFYQVTPLLKWVLWVEAVIYLGIGLYEVFDDFWAKSPDWANQANGINAWIRMQDVIGRKMHAAICVILGFVALNGALEGHVTRFELELIFISFAVLMPVIWSMTMPGRLGFLVIVLKPEFWLQLIMFIFFSHLVRPEILAICIALNCWGILVNTTYMRKVLFKPYTYRELRKHIVSAKGEEYARRLDKVAGYKP